MGFVRKISSEFCDRLKGERLYQDHLLPDIREGKVFPAIRNNSVDFYFEGGNLFKYSNSFRTRTIYSLVVSDGTSETISETDLPIKLIGNFSEGYSKIKANCRRYHKNKESSYVARLYHGSSYLLEQHNTVVLDIEIALAGLETAREEDRIDFVLLNKRMKTLRFYEAKKRDNTSIQVMEQIKTYERQVGEKKEEILRAYKDYAKSVHALFGFELCEPQRVDPKVPLIVFGISRRERVPQELASAFDNEGIRFHQVSSGRDLTADRLWEICS